ncbi:hypothetical protein [Fusobacterium necrophorum]|uniref:hypothetical protein n=1 Tax=Fusobacterium necrophorum TaxID=859 RepID=UPI00370E091E
MVTEEMMCKLLRQLIIEKKSITLREFIEVIIPENFSLDEDDLKESTTRPGEKMYEQRARNINSHKTFPNNVRYENQTFFEK